MRFEYRLYGEGNETFRPCLDNGLVERALYRRFQRVWVRIVRHLESGYAVGLERIIIRAQKT